MTGPILDFLVWAGALLRGRSRAYLVAVCLAAGLVIWLFLMLVQSLWGVILVVALSAGLGYAAERFYASPNPHGLLGATVIGLVGALIGQRLFGSLGPSVAGIGLIPAFAGILLVHWALRASRLAGRARVLDSYQAKGGTDPLILSRLEDYRIIQHLGSGGYAKVYKAVPERTLSEDEAIAVKIFTDDTVDSEEFSERLRREVELTQRLSHPGIVRVMKSGEQEKLRYIMMEYVDGAPLSIGSQLELPEKLDLVIQVAKALGFAHSVGVIHRDIKPDNIMLTKSGPRLMDFGLARHSGKSSLTQTGSALGTPNYMAPEQIQGVQDLDARCDQYSLGCVLFALLTGRTPYIAEQSVQVMMKHLSEPPPDPRELRPELPESLSAIVLRMMAKDREDRFPNLEAMIPQLQKIQAELKSRSTSQPSENLASGQARP